CILVTAAGPHQQSARAARLRGAPGRHLPYWLHTSRHQQGRCVRRPHVLPPQRLHHGSYMRSRPACLCAPPPHSHHSVLLGFDPPPVLRCCTLSPFAERDTRSPVRADQESSLHSVSEVEW